MSATTIVQARRELAHRVSGGFEVALYWSALDDSTSVEIWQRASGEILFFTSPPSTPSTPSTIPSPIFRGRSTHDRSGAVGQPLHVASLDIG